MRINNNLDKLLKNIGFSDDESTFVEEVPHTCSSVKGLISLYGYQPFSVGKTDK